MIYILQHASYEKPGSILDWLESVGHNYQIINLHQNDPLPQRKNEDALIIMGGPMNVYEENRYAWLKGEKQFIGEWIEARNRVLGICFGSQLNAAALCAIVKRNSATEIGWFKVTIDQTNLPHQYQNVFPESFIGFHWHGDTFEIPAGAISFASSEATISQGYAFKNHVIGLQFHPEITQLVMEGFIENDIDDLLSESVFVQTAEEMQKHPGNFNENKRIMFRLLDSFLK